jgi:uncharacterized membrane protein YfcA
VPAAETTFPAWLEDRVMTGNHPFVLLSAAVFAGAFVSGLAGFAFSAVAGAVLFHMLPPTEAVPLMMACSIAVQAANLWSSRSHIELKESLTLIAGGIAGIPIAVYLLQNAGAAALRAGFGVLVGIYAAYGLFRPALASVEPTRNRATKTLVGFGGGLIGGLTAMPGALPTIWCDLHGMPKTRQRALVQPFIAVMQIFALALMLRRNDLSMTILVDFAISLPALIAGTALGILMFKNVNDLLFRKIILVVLFFSSLSLLV